MPTINNYTFSDVQFNITEGSNITDTVGATASLIITPNTGFSATASNFSATGFDTNYISSVVFTQSGSNVLCTINLVSTGTMPSSNLTLGLCVVGSAEILEITIAGKINAIIGSNITGGSSETNTPYNNSGSQGLEESLFTRTYNANSGYFMPTTPSCNIVQGNQSNYNITQTPSYNSGNQLTGISFNVKYIYPANSVSGDIINIEASDAELIYVKPQVITGYRINNSTIQQTGGVINLRIYGDLGAVFSVNMADSLGNTYAIETNVVMGSTGIFNTLISIPAVYSQNSNVVYTVTLSGNLASPFSLQNPFTITQVVRSVYPKISINAVSTKGITGFSSVEAVGRPFFRPKIGTDIIEVDWNLTVASGAISYLNNIEIGDFSNVLAVALNTKVNASVTNSATVTLDNTYSSIQIGDEFNLYQGAVTKAPFQFKITGINGAQLTVSPNITVSAGEDIFIFRNNGNLISNPIVTATQTNSSNINFKMSVQIDSFGDDDAAFTLNLDNIINKTTESSCSSSITNGTSGITDYIVNLDPAGGVISYLVDPIGVADKFEILHGLSNGVKKATSSMTASNNYGPFDNLWGTEPVNDIPTASQVGNVDQFIGTNKGTIPTRQSEFNSNTSFTVPNMTVASVDYKQVVWWKYTAADYTKNPIATIRITGSTGTLWKILRICCPDSNCT